MKQRTKCHYLLKTSTATTAGLRHYNLLPGTTRCYVPNETTCLTLLAAKISHLFPLPDPLTYPIVPQHLCGPYVIEGLGRGSGYIFNTNRSFEVPAFYLLSFIFYLLFNLST